MVWLCCVCLVLSLFYVFLCEAAYDLFKIAHDSVRKHWAGNAVRRGRHAALTGAHVDGRRSVVGTGVPVRVIHAVARRHAPLGHVLIQSVDSVVIVLCTHLNVSYCMAVNLTQTPN